jgi:hypothetical protein
MLSKEDNKVIFNKNHENSCLRTLSSDDGTAVLYNMD